MTVDWKAELFTEKSLWTAYRVSRTLLRSRFNLWTIRVCFILSFSVSAIRIWNKSPVAASSALISISDIGFSLSSQILGFLIGGFAIFATISDSRLMVRLAQTTMPDKSLSVFKTVFYNFLSVFAIYVATLSFSLAIKIGSAINVINLYRYVNSDVCDYILTTLNSILFLILSTLIALSVLRLKSFIWNIYQAFLTFMIVGDLQRQADVEEKLGSAQNNQ